MAIPAKCDLLMFIGEFSFPMYFARKLSFAGLRFLPGIVFQLDREECIPKMERKL